MKQAEDPLLVDVALQGGGSGRHLEQSIFDLANLPNVDLSGAYLEGASLVGTQFRGAFLNGALGFKAQSSSGPAFRARRLFGVQLMGAFLNRAQLQGASLVVLNLSGASLSNAQLQQVSLSRDHFMEASDKLAGQGERVLGLAVAREPGDQGRKFSHRGRSAREFRLAWLDRAPRPATQGSDRGGDGNMVGRQAEASRTSGVTASFLNTRPRPVRTLVAVIKSFIGARASRSKSIVSARIARNGLFPIGFKS